MSALRGVLCLVALSAMPRVGSSQSAASAPGVTLQEVVSAALADNTQIRTEWLRAEGFRGSVLAKQAPFDLQLTTVVQRNHDKKQIDAQQFAREQGTSYQLGVVKQLRSGITLTPTLQVASARYALPGAVATGSASAGLDVVVPLMYDRGGAVSATAVRVAELDLETMRGVWRSAVTSGANAAVGAYWSYVAAVRRVDVQRDAESRAKRLLDETTQLVEKEERAPADLQQLRATVASRRAARILAEQSVDEARVQLGVLMGLDAGRTLALGAPATDFPKPVEARATDSASVRRLRDLAMARRPDLTMQRTSNRAWALELQQVRNAQQPRLDLDLTLGYQGFTQGPGYDHLVSPLYRNVPGLNATVQLRYQLAFANSGARGQVMFMEASVQQQRLALRDVERQVATDVAVGALGVDRSAVALREAEEAVALYRITVDNEQRKLRLGMNTLFDVLNSEDALTNALLAAINNRRAHATALATLRLATGTLADVSGELTSVDAARLLSPP